MSTHNLVLQEALRGSWQFAERTFLLHPLSVLCYLREPCSTFACLISASARAHVLGALFFRDQTPENQFIMNGITSMTTASTRACYYRHFSELIARVRNAKRVTPKSAENLSPILSEF